MSSENSLVDLIGNKHVPRFREKTLFVTGAFIFKNWIYTNLTIRLFNIFLFRQEWKMIQNYILLIIAHLRIAHLYKYMYVM